MIDIICQFGVLLGIALWLPAPAASGHWLGARFMLAGYIFVLYLFLGNVVVGLPVSGLTWVGLAAGLAGLIAALARPNRAVSVRDLTHPIFLLTVLFFAVVAVRGEVAYQPYLGDETASWLNLSKQIYLADHYRSDLMDYHLPNYVNGWPLLVAATSSIYSSYDDAHAIPLLFFMHLGGIAFIYDIVRSWASDVRPRDVAAATLTGWIAVVVLLAGEITWRLLPTDLLIEQPMLYAYVACFLIAIAGQDLSAPARRLFIYWGIVLGAGYLFKVSMLAIAPTVALFVLTVLWRDIRSNGASGSTTRSNLRRLCEAGVLTFVPLAVVMAVWTAASPGDMMGSSVGQVPASNLALLFSADGWTVTLRMLEELREFCLRYKLPLTLVTGAAMLSAAWSARWRTVLIGFVAFVAATWAGLYLYYLFREPFLTRGYLESFPRFAILPLRIFHLIGFMALTYAALRIALPRMELVSKRTAVRIGLIGIIGIGLAWQIRQVTRSAEDMADRRYQSADLIQTLMRYKAGLLRIQDDIARLGLDAPRLAIFDPRGDVATTTALYYSLKTQRESTPRSYRYFKPVRVSSLDRLASFDMVWPIGANESETARIIDLLSDPACAARLKDHILLRVVGERLDCLTSSTKP